ncbi:MAG: YdeI/OmpD-associated family protein [Pseudonocardia sp.]|nr:YdeI/OmpD-associated family protein [Pseudonocardia sp.]
MTAGEHLEHVEITSEHALRAWLAEHHGQRAGVWIVTWKKHVPDRHVTHEQVLDQLIAFGWTDGILRRIDADRTRQLVSPRRTKPWAKSYKDRVERLITEGRIHPAGLAAVEQAKATGMWDAMNDVDALQNPDDLTAALQAHPPADVNFHAFPPSGRRNILRWIASARTPETRTKRIDRTVADAQRNVQVKSNG